jgi:hypothetical protein
MIDSGAGAGDPYVCIERQGRSYRVRGSPAARIDHPWPRDPASSDVFAEWNWDGKTLHVRNDPWDFSRCFTPLTRIASPSPPPHCAC